MFVIKTIFCFFFFAPVGVSLTRLVGVGGLPGTVPFEMALLLKETGVWFNYAMDEVSDPRVKDWYLMGSPYPIILLSIIYLYITKKLGPELMEDRQPFNIDRILLLFNVIQIGLNFFMVFEGIRVGLSKYNPLCNAIDYSDAPDSVYVARIIWLYFLTKVSDLLDTVFFIMRKKYNQVSFLHVYHHWGMLLLSWTFAKFVGGGTILYVIVINSFVHSVMYAYYLLTTYDKSYQKSLWWKKHITQLQLIQFGVLLVQHLQLLGFQSCGFPKWILWALIPQNIMIFVLFADFYYKAYVKPRRSVK